MYRHLYTYNKNLSNILVLKFIIVFFKEKYGTIFLI